MTNTEMAQVKAKWKVCSPNVSHKIKVIIAIAITIGTNTPLILSASLAIGALDELAYSTNSIILDNVVSFDVFKTRI